MKLIKLTCPRCGSQMEASTDLQTVFCTCCGNKMLVKNKIEKIGQVNKLNSIGRIAYIVVIAFFMSILLMFSALIAIMGGMSLCMAVAQEQGSIYILQYVTLLPIGIIFVITAIFILIALCKKDVLRKYTMLFRFSIVGSIASVVSCVFDVGMRVFFYFILFIFLFILISSFIKMKEYKKQYR